MATETIVGSIRALEGGVAPHGGMVQPNHTVTVVFQAGQTAKLSTADPDYPWYSRVFRNFLDAGLPVYVEIQSETRTISEILIPLQGGVTASYRDATGDLKFHLDSSSKPFCIRSTNPNLSAYISILKDAWFDGAPVLVSERPDGAEVVDLRRLEPVSPLISRRDPLLDARLRPAVFAADVDELFAAVAAKTCGVASTPGCCIPFLFPKNGCHTRAHAMCQVLIGLDVRPGKIWNYPTAPRRILTVSTANDPNCQVDWAFHVAATIQVAADDGTGSQTLVFDPSLFRDGPVTPSQWHAIQGDPASTPVFSTFDVYYRAAGGNYLNDPQFQYLHNDLVTFTTQFESQVRCCGAPPYPCPRIAGSTC